MVMIVRHYNGTYALGLTFCNFCGNSDISLSWAIVLARYMSFLADTGMVNLLSR